jgi:hypothetical protein
VSAASADNTAADSIRSDTQSIDPASDIICLIKEHLQSLNTQMDAQARTHSELLRRDALRDYPVAIGTAATPLVDTPYMLTGELVHAPQREHAHIGSNNNRRFTIDHDFVAMTADWATVFDGDSFSRSFRTDAPLMPKTCVFKFWKRDVLSNLPLKAAALIPQLAMSSPGVPLNPVAQRYAHAMLVQCCRYNIPIAQAIAGVSAGRHDCGTAAWDWMYSPSRAQCHSWTV